MCINDFEAYKEEGALSFGEMWAKGINLYIKPGLDDVDYKTIEEWQPFGDPTLAIGEESDPPATPGAPSGPTSGVINTEYTYTASTTDPNGDDLYYMFDWDDGTTSGWVGPFSSGATASAKKTWTQQGSFEVKVAAKDDHGKLSDWSNPLPVSIPRNHLPVFNLMQQILERFPNAFPILRVLLGF